MERKKTVVVPGVGPVEATEVGFRSEGEYWNQYLADDGTVIKIRLLVTEVLRVDGTYDAEGNPGYMVKSTNVTSISAPEEMRRPPT
jgi:hypothetical protein